MTSFPKRFPALLTPILLLPLAGAAPATNLQVGIEGLRSQRGTIHLCLTRDPAHFPNCGDDPRSVKRSIAASAGGGIAISGIAPGAYALSAIHDENRNGRLDTFVGIPREGFGFSRNPVVRFGAPRFSQVQFRAPSGITRLRVRMQYLL